jgi:hypothetical protein
MFKEPIMKTFDPNSHDHQCPRCHKSVYCCAPACEIAKQAECLECRSGDTTERFMSAIFFGYFGYRRDGKRKTWPGRDEIETYRAPYRAPRNRRKQ